MTIQEKAVYLTKRLQAFDAYLFVEVDRSRLECDRLLVVRRFMGHTNLIRSGLRSFVSADALCHEIRMSDMTKFRIKSKFIRNTKMLEEKEFKALRKKMEETWPEYRDFFNGKKVFNIKK